MAKITIIGAGNVAWHLTQKLKQCGHEIVAVFSRDIRKANELAEKVNAKAVADIKQLDTKATIYILAIKDDAIASVAEQLSYLKSE